MLDKKENSCTHIDVYLGVYTGYMLFTVSLSYAAGRPICQWAIRWSMPAAPGYDPLVDDR